MEGRSSARAFDEPLDPLRMVTVLGTLKYAFDALDDLYIFGTTRLNHGIRPDEAVPPNDAYCLEFCQPEAQTKVVLTNWLDLRRVYQFMCRRSAESSLATLDELEELLAGQQVKSLVSSEWRFIEHSPLFSVYRSGTCTLQCYATVSGPEAAAAPAKHPLIQFGSTAAPGHILPLTSFGSFHQVRILGPLLTV